MTFQYIINHLNKPHLWYIVLTAPHAELSTQKKLERQDLSLMFRRLRFGALGTDV